jgi:hypothetical protein
VHDRPGDKLDVDNRLGPDAAVRLHGPGRDLAGQVRRGVADVDLAAGDIGARDLRRGQEAAE